MKKFHEVAKNNFYLLSAFLLSAVLVFIAFMAIGLAPLGEKSILTLDTTQIYYPSIKEFKRLVEARGSFLFTWHGGMGMNGSASVFANLTNPFNLFVLLFPMSNLFYAIMATEISMIAFSAATFAFFAHKDLSISKRESAMFSILYALSSYATVYSVSAGLLYGMIFLPITLHFTNVLLEKNKVLGFTISFALIFIFNYYMGYMVGGFTFLFFIYKIVLDKRYSNLKSMFTTVIKFFYGVAVAAACAAAVVVPIYYVLKDDSGLMNQSLPPVGLSFQPFLFLGQLFLGSYQHIESCLPNIFSGILVTFCLPIYFLSAKISKRKKICAAGILLVMYISMLIPPLNILWHAGDSPNWYNFRYSFAFSFFIVMLVAQEFENIVAFGKNSISAIVALSLVFVLFLLYQFSTSGHLKFLTTKVFIINVGLILFWYLLLRLKDINRFFKSNFKSIVLVGVCIEMLISAIFMFKATDVNLGYQLRAKQSNIDAAFQPVFDKIKNMDDSFYRVEMCVPNSLNSPLRFGYNGITHITSLANVALNLKLIKFGYKTLNLSTDRLVYTGYTLSSDSLFGIKYTVTNSDLKLLYDKQFQSDSGLIVFENPYVFPVVYSASKRVLHETLENGTNPLEVQNLALKAINGSDELDFLIPIEAEDTKLEGTQADFKLNTQKVKAYDRTKPVNYSQTSVFKDSSKMMYMILPGGKHNYKISENDTILAEGVNNDSEERYGISTYIKQGSVLKLEVSLPERKDENISNTQLVEEIRTSPKFYNSMFYYFDFILFSKLADRVKGSVSSLEVPRESQLKATVEVFEDNVVMTSIPYNEGWGAKIDGKPAQTKRAFEVFMAIEAEPGIHELELSFFPYGLKTGIIISLLGLLLVIEIWYKERRRKHSA